MKLFPTIALLAIAAATLIPASQAQRVALKANIPFDFAVGDDPLPAGVYTITSPDAGLIRFASADGHYAATVVASHGFNESNHGSQLVFDRYGNDYFLHEILCPMRSSMNVEIGPWKLERRAQARWREAKAQNGDQTLVAAK